MASCNPLAEALRASSTSSLGLMPVHPQQKSVSNAGQRRLPVAVVPRQPPPSRLPATDLRLSSWYSGDGFWIQRTRCHCCRW